MQHDAGGIDDAPQGRPFQRQERLFDASLRRQIVGPAAQDLGAKPVEGAANLGHHERPREARQGRGDPFQDLMDRREFTELWAVGHEFDGTRLSWRGATGTLKVSGRGSAWLERLVRDQEVGGSKPLAPTKLLIDLQRFPPNTRVQTGSAVDPTLTRMLHPVGRCSLVLIDLQSDDLADPLGSDQEVW